MKLAGKTPRQIISEELYVPNHLRAQPYPAHIFERAYVTDILGIKLPLNESYPYSLATEKRIVQEQLLMEGFFGDLMAKGKEVADDMIEKGKAKLMSAKEGIAKFGKEAWSILTAFWNVIKGGAADIASFTKRIARRGFDGFFSQIKAALTFLAEKLPGWGMPTFGGWAEKGLEMLTSFREKVVGLDGWKRVIGFAGLAVGLHYIWDKVGEWIEELKEKIGGDFKALVGLEEADGDESDETVVDKTKGAVIGWIKDTAKEKLKEFGDGGLKKVMEQLASVTSGVKPWWDAAVKIAGGAKLVIDALGDGASAYMGRKSAADKGLSLESRRYISEKFPIATRGDKVKITKRQLRRIIREAIKDEPIRMASGDSFSKAWPSNVTQRGSSEYSDTIVMSPNADSVLVNGKETYVEDVPQELSIASGFPMSDTDANNLIFVLEDQMSGGYVELGVKYENGKWNW